jgi:hypothetical protein
LKPGGRKKNSDGTWSSKTPLQDNTRVAIAYAKEVGEYEVWATIKKKPIGYAKCEKYVKSHKNTEYVC